MAGAKVEFMLWLFCSDVAQVEVEMCSLLRNYKLVGRIILTRAKVSARVVIVLL